MRRRRLLGSSRGAEAAWGGAVADDGRRARVAASRSAMAGAVAIAAGAREMEGAMRCRAGAAVAMVEDGEEV